MAKNPAWSRDELILALDLYLRVDPIHTTEKDPAIMELSRVLNSLPIHAVYDRNPTFRNPNGVYMKLCNFLRFDPSYKGTGLDAGNKLEGVIWREFNNNRDALAQIVAAINANAGELSRPRSQAESKALIDEAEEFLEGTVLMRCHRFRERNPLLVRKKKAMVLKNTGRLACEVCGFDYKAFYGAIGEGFAECHHNRPLSELAQRAKAKLSDLAILCANCHRIIHKARPWLSVAELSVRINRLGDCRDPGI